MGKLWKIIKEEKVLLTVTLTLVFFLVGYVYNLKSGNINLGCLILPLDKTIDWDPSKSAFKENNMPKENGYIVIIRNSADETLTVEFNIRNIVNPKNILTYNFGTHDKILKYDKSNGYKFKDRLKVEALQISQDSELPLVFLSDSIDPFQIPKVTHATRLIAKASVFTIFEKFLWCGIFVVAGMVLSWLFPNLLMGVKGIIYLINVFYVLKRGDRKIFQT